MGEHIVCKRCGFCCHFIVDGVRQKCKYLIRIPKTNRTYCKIYKDRNPNKRILADNKDGSFVTCNMRENVLVNFPDCPYNRPEWDDYSEKIYTKEWAIKHETIKANLDKCNNKKP